MTRHEPISILLIEDDENDERLVRRALSRSGVSLVLKVARNGAHALSALRTERYDLVISDMKLPMLSGNEVLIRAKKDGALDSVPYVVFSSSDDPFDIEACLSAGASDYVTKPVDYGSFLRAVQNIVRRWLVIGAANQMAV